jgi:hypothetical protein
VHGLPVASIPEAIGLIVISGKLARRLATGLLTALEILDKFVELECPLERILL